MLVLTRKEGQRIEIKTEGGARIVVTLLEANHMKARIGIEAPREVAILRDDAKKREA
jgi:carbon storage regulator